MGGESLTLADGAASWTIKDVRTERRGMDTSQLLLNLLRTNLGCGVNILLKLGVVTNVT